MTALAAPPAAMAVDRDCVNDSSEQLNEQLSQAYEDYSEEMQQLAEQLNERTQMAYVSSSSSNNGNRNQVTLNQGIINAAYQEYSYGQTEANRRLGSKVQQAWNSYYAQSSACDPNGNQYHNAGQYQYNQYQYPYGNYQYQYYQYPYGNYQQYQSYPYNYGNYQYQYYQPYYQQYQYQYYYPHYRGGASSGVQYYADYGVQYNSNGQYICPQVVMTTLPSGCGYDCALDSSGCRRCEISCRRSVERGTCGCANSLRPVCGKDGVTYTNECQADCAGVDVRKQGVCA